MSTDIETQLARLGERFRTEITHVDPDEILHHAEPAAELAQTVQLDRSTRPDRHPARRRWIPAAAAALVAFLVGGLALINQRDDGGVGVSDTSCAASRYPVSFDGQLFPAVDSDLSVTGFSTAEAAADAYLADRIAGTDVPGLDVTYSIISAASADGPNTIVRAQLRSGDAVGTVDVATRAVELTDVGTRWIVQAAASDVTDLDVGDFDGGRVSVGVEPHGEGSGYASTHDRFNGELIDSGGFGTDGTTPERPISLEAGSSTAPSLRYWFVGTDQLSFGEVELNQGYSDFGEGWQSLERHQLC
jgi:hypothetical protein